jgi:putative selenate reductase
MMAKKARLEAPQAVPSLPVEKRGGFTEVLQSMSAEAARAEAARCLDCDEVCSLCVTVCPNRANLAYVVAPLSLEFPSFVVEGGEAVPRGTTTLHVEQHVQIVNLADACNECGNCTTFCPTSGSPFRDKPRFWLDREGFEKARSDAYRMTRENGSVVIEAKIAGHSHRLERGPAIATYRSGVLSATLDPTSWKLVATKVEGAPVEGEAVDLGTCAHLIALLHAEPALPPL